MNTINLFKLLTGGKNEKDITRIISMNVLSGILMLSLVIIGVV